MRNYPQAPGSVDLVARSQDGTVETRGAAYYVHGVHHTIEPSFNGDEVTATADFYASRDNEDSGGFVLRLQLHSVETAFRPKVKENADGSVEISMCGETEGEAMQLALLSLLRQVALHDGKHY
uniref:Uncharacterized protein n=1 Tax=uncultured Caudovirales phage TaxID=2100421 RepID=A0A6J5L331_9CAUD|nr:hypothetical protein UFOVP114_11 [uncultured Caudovirales phage]